MEDISSGNWRQSFSIQIATIMSIIDQASFTRNPYQWLTAIETLNIKVSSYLKNDQEKYDNKINDIRKILAKANKNMGMTTRQGVKQAYYLQGQALHELTKLTKDIYKDVIPLTQPDPRGRL